MEKVVTRFKRFQKISMLMFVLNIIAGLLLLYYGDSFSNDSIRVSFGSIIIFNGLFNLIKYFYDGFGSSVYKSQIIVGLASLVLGLFTTFGNLDVFQYGGIIYGIWFLLIALELLFYTYKLFKKNEEIYPLIGTISLLIIVASVITMINPFSSFMTNVRLIVLLFVTISALEVMVSLLFNKRALEVLKIFGK